MEARNLSHFLHCISVTIASDSKATSCTVSGPMLDVNVRTVKIAPLFRWTFIFIVLREALNVDGSVLHGLLGSISSIVLLLLLLFQTFSSLFYLPVHL